MCVWEVLPFSLRFTPPNQRRHPAAPTSRQAPMDASDPCKDRRKQATEHRDRDRERDRDTDRRSGPPPYKKVLSPVARQTCLINGSIYYSPTLLRPVGELANLKSPYPCMHTPGRLLKGKGRIVGQCRRKPTSGTADGSDEYSSLKNNSFQLELRSEKRPLIYLCIFGRDRWCPYNLMGWCVRACRGRCAA